MLATILQIVALIGLPVGGFMQSIPAGVVCTAVSVGYVGLAAEKKS